MDLPVIHRGTNSLLAIILAEDISSWCNLNTSFVCSIIQYWFTYKPKFYFVIADDDNFLFLTDAIYWLYL